MITTMKSKRGSQARPRWLKPLLLFLAVAILFGVSRFFHLEDRLRDLHHWIRSLGPWGGPAVFALLFALGIICALPGSAMTLMAGLFFKTPMAVLAVTAGAALGSAATFLIARVFAR